jgi:hypothetical protein
MPSTTQVEWLNENSLRAYPFAENSTRIPNDPSGGLMPEAYALPNYLLVDAILTMPYSDDMPDLFISSVTLAGGVLTMVVSAYIRSSGDERIVGSVSVSVDSPVNTVAKFAGSGEYDGAFGALVFGDLRRFESMFPDGIFAFDRSQTMLETRCARPSARCVSGLFATDAGSAYSTRTLYGNVALIAGTNVKLTYIESVNGIQIDVSPNEGYSDKCSCDGSDSEVKSINGISVSNVTIAGGDCISVSTSGGRVTIEDTCAKPCCGCEELNFVNMKANELVTASGRLSSFLSDLSSRLDDFKTNFLDSERSPVKIV